MHTHKRLKVFFTFYVCTHLFFGINASYGDEGRQVLDKKAIEAFLNSEFQRAKESIVNGHLSDLKDRLERLTHEQSLFLFEFTLKLPGSTIPQRRAYYERDPFVKLVDHANILKENGLEMAYEVERFEPQYGGKAAILHDKGSATGMISDPLTGKPFAFELKQSCRNTISVHANTMIKFDSVYCRMEIDYRPVDRSE